MKITVVDCGNAFSDDNFNQSFLLEESGKKLLDNLWGKSLRGGLEFIEGLSRHYIGSQDRVHFSENQFDKAVQTIR